MKRKKLIWTVVLTVLVAGILFLNRPTQSPKFLDNQGKELPNSIALDMNVPIGGVSQNLLIRGESKGNPILLILHGGPGSSYDAFAHAFQSDLEKEFVVVHWSQRGAGKSYHWNISNESMNLDQMISDGKEVMDYLCHTYQKEKVYLLGHSWGTALGTYMARDFPDKVHAYIGAAQIVDLLEQEKASYDYTLAQAKSRNDVEAQEELAEIGRPPYRDLMNGMMVKVNYFTKFEGYMDGMTNQELIIDAIMESPEYNGMDIMQLLYGMLYSLKNMLGNAGDEVWEISPMKYANEFEVPVYIIQGQKDHMVQNHLVHQYFEILQAPNKELLEMDAGHMMFFEQPELFCQMIIDIKKDLESKE
ncbi:MAG: alpha/beta hydrolase [Reichenbachiella sp.]